MNNNVESFLRMMRHPFKFNFYLFTKLPAAYFAGVRVKDIDAKYCIVTVPFKWLSQNPFRSTYFACLSMAAEMSTGLLAILNCHKRSPGISMLVTKVEGDFYKKAVGITSFVCKDGKLLQDTVEKCVSFNMPQSIRVESVGTNVDGEVVAVFYFTWSFKVRG